MTYGDELERVHSLVRRARRLEDPFETLRVLSEAREALTNARTAIERASLPWTARARMVNHLALNALIRSVHRLEEVTHDKRVQRRGEDARTRIVEG